jgi:hypothetical protein
MKPQAPAPEPPPPLPTPRPAADAWLTHRQNERLDEELDGTFPASDPVPWQHEP